MAPKTLLARLQNRSSRVLVAPKHFGAPTESLFKNACCAQITLARLQNRSSRVLVAPKTLWRAYRIALHGCLLRPKHFGAPTESLFTSACCAENTLARLQNRSSRVFVAPKNTLARLQIRSSRVLVAPKPFWRAYRTAPHECLWRPSQNCMSRATS